MTSTRPKNLEHLCQLIEHGRLIKADAYYARIIEQLADRFGIEEVVMQGKVYRYFRAVK